MTPSGNDSQSDVSEVCAYQGGKSRLSPAGPASPLRVGGGLPSARTQERASERAHARWIEHDQVCGRRVRTTRMAGRLIRSLMHLRRIIFRAIKIHRQRVAIKSASATAPQTPRPANDGAAVTSNENSLYARAPPVPATCKMLGIPWRTQHKLHETFMTMQSFRAFIPSPRASIQSVGPGPIAGRNAE